MYGFSQGPIPPIFNSEPPAMSPNEEKMEDTFTGFAVAKDNEIDDWSGFVTSSNTNSNDDNFGVWQSNSPPPLSPAADDKSPSEIKQNDYTEQLKTTMQSSDIDHITDESSFGYFYKDDSVDQDSTLNSGDITLHGDSKADSFDNVYFKKETTGHANLIGAVNSSDGEIVTTNEWGNFGNLIDSSKSENREFRKFSEIESKNISSESFGDFSQTITAGKQNDDFGDFSSLETNNKEKQSTKPDSESGDSFGDFENFRQTNIEQPNEDGFGDFNNGLPTINNREQSIVESTSGVQSSDNFGDFGNFSDTNIEKQSTADFSNFSDHTEKTIENDFENFRNDSTANGNKERSSTTAESEELGNCSEDINDKPDNNDLSCINSNDSSKISCKEQWTNDNKDLTDPTSDDVPLSDDFSNTKVDKPNDNDFVNDLSPNDKKEQSTIKLTSDVQSSEDFRGFGNFSDANTSEPNDNDFENDLSANDNKEPSTIKLTSDVESSDNLEGFGNFADTNIGVSNDNEFGDFGNDLSENDNKEPSTIKLTSGVQSSEDFGGFENFSDKNIGEQNDNEFGDFGNKEQSTIKITSDVQSSEDFGGFGNFSDTNIGEPNANDFGNDLSANIIIKEPISDDFGDFGNFSDTNIDNIDKTIDNSFGNFSETNTSDSSSNNFGDFGGFSESGPESKESDFGDFGNFTEDLGKPLEKVSY